MNLISETYYSCERREYVLWYFESTYYGTPIVHNNFPFFITYNKNSGAISCI